MKLRYKVSAILAFLLGIFLWGRHSRKPVLPPSALPPSDLEQIIVDPHKHTIIVKRPTGTIVATLPDRETVIDIRRNGKVDITSPQWGFERRLFVGLHGSEAFRVAMGLDFFFWKRMDIGIGAAGQIGPHVPIAFGQVSYNFYSNCRIGLTYGTNRYAGGTLSVRL